MMTKTTKTTKTKIDKDALEKKMIRNNEKIRKLQAENYVIEETLKNVTENAFPYWTGKLVTISGTLAMAFAYEILALYGKFSRAVVCKGQIIVTLEFATILAKEKYVPYCHNSFKLFTLQDCKLAYMHDNDFALKEADDSVLDKAFEEMQTVATVDICRLIKKCNTINDKDNERTESNVLLGTHPEGQEQD